MKVLLDTSVIIDFLRQKQKERTPLFSLSDEDLYISMITHTELYAGKSVWEKESAAKELEQLFSDMIILPLQKDISKRAGAIKAKNQTLSLLDAIIAATAIHHSLPVATLNIKDFQPIKDLTLYPL